MKPVLLVLAAGALAVLAGVGPDCCSSCKGGACAETARPARSAPASAEPPCCAESAAPASSLGPADEDAPARCLHADGPCRCTAAPRSRSRDDAARPQRTAEAPAPAAALSVDRAVPRAAPTEGGPAPLCRVHPTIATTVLRR